MADIGTVILGVEKLLENSEIAMDELNTTDCLVIIYSLRP